MKGILSSVLVAAAMAAAGPALSQPTPPAAARAANLSKVFMSMPAGAVYAEIKGGLFCVPNRTLTYSGGRTELRSTTYVPPFQTEMEKAGYKTGADNVFQSASDVSDYDVAAVITDEHIDACVATNGTNAKGDASMKIEWQVYSRLRQQVVGRYTTIGTFALHDSLPGGLQMLTNGVFGENARQLATNTDFKRLLAEAAPTSGSVIAQGADARIALAGNTVAPTRDVSEATGDVLVVITGGGSGSGVLVSQDGYVLTDAHVVGGSKTVKLRWSDGLETTGDVVRSNTTRDVALIKTDPRGRVPLPVKRGTVTQGQPVYAIGSPLGEKFQGSVSKGVISANRVFDGVSFIQSDVSVAPGSSGGPLLDDAGHVIGLAVGQYRVANAPTGLNMFIPIGDALDFLQLDAR